MISRKQRAIYMASGGAAAAALIWLRYGKSAARTRQFLGDAVGSVSRSLESIQSTLSTIQRRTEEVDRFIHGLVQVGSENRVRAEEVLNETLERLEQTAEVIQSNLTRSSDDIAALLRDIRIGVEHAVHTDPSRAA